MFFYHIISVVWTDGILVVVTDPAASAAIKIKQWSGRVYTYHIFTFFYEDFVELFFLFI